jgi:hypothetical protein
MWTIIKDAIIQLFTAITVLCKAAENLSKSVENATSAIEVQSRTLIPTDEQLAADLETSRIQRDITLVENLNKLLAKCKDDNAQSAIIQSKIDQIKQANQPK